jgi:hypothetical protein
MGDECTSLLIVQFERHNPRLIYFVTNLLTYWVKQYIYKAHNWIFNDYKAQPNINYIIL